MWKIESVCGLNPGDKITYRDLYEGNLPNKKVSLLGWMWPTTSGTYGLQNLNDLGLQLEDEYADEQFYIDEIIPCKFDDGDDCIIIVGRDIYEGKPEAIEDWEGSDEFIPYQDAVALLKDCLDSVVKTDKEKEIIKSYGY